MLGWLGYLSPWLWPWIFNVKLYLGNGRPDCHGTKGTGVDRMPWYETLRKWVNWTLHRLGYLWPWPWIFKGKLYLRNGRSDCHGTKWTGVDRMTWCETLRKWVIWMLRWLGYLWPWIVKVKLYLGNGRPECHGTKGRGMPWCETLRKRVNRTPRWLGYFWPLGWESDRMPWRKRQPLCDLEAEETDWDQGDLRCRRFRRLVLVLKNSTLIDNTDTF